MSATDRLPEGTDSIIDDGGDVDRDQLAAETGPALDELDDGDDLDDLNSDPSESSAGRNASSRTDSAAGGGAGFTVEGIRSAFFGHVDTLKGGATDKAFAFAQTGKDRATGALDDVIRMVEDAAEEIDQKLGSQYGDYARRAAQTLGGFSDTVRDKPVEELFDDAKALVQKSPAVAIGAAAAIGFVVARIARAGFPDNSGSGGDASQA